MKKQSNQSWQYDVKIRKKIAAKPIPPLFKP
jgi:hypothetical protein